MLKRTSWLGIALIVIGAVMLLHRIDLLPYDWHVAFWGLLTVLGATLVVRGFSGPKRKGAVFWGTMLFLFAGYRTLVELDILWIPFEFRFPLFVMMIGTAFLALYLTAVKEWHVLVPAVVFLGLGSLILASQMGYLDRWELLDAFRNYWPIVLILFGASLLFNRKST